MTQLPMILPLRPAQGREHFFVSPANALALASLEKGDWPMRRLALVGPQSSGKTHLALVWAAQSGARVVDGAALTAADVPDLASRPLVLEDADRGVAEDALLHLLNAAAEAGQPVLLTARAAPAHWGTRLPDLASRLGAMLVARLNPPDDALLAALFAKHFADRQLRHPPELIPWLLSRVERSAHEAERLVALLDAAALAEQRPLTLPFARRVLGDAMA